MSAQCELGEIHMPSHSDWIKTSTSQVMGLNVGKLPGGGLALAEGLEQRGDPRLVGGDLQTATPGGQSLLTV